MSNVNTIELLTLQGAFSNSPSELYLQIIRKPFYFLSHFPPPWIWVCVYSLLFVVIFSLYKLKLQSPLSQTIRSCSSILPFDEKLQRTSSRTFTIFPLPSLILPITCTTTILLFLSTYSLRFSPPPLQFFFFPFFFIHNLIPSQQQTVSLSPLPCTTTIHGPLITEMLKTTCQLLPTAIREPHGHDNSATMLPIITDSDSSRWGEGGGKKKERRDDDMPINR